MKTTVIYLVKDVKEGFEYYIPKKGAAARAYAEIEGAKTIEKLTIPLSASRAVICNFLNHKSFVLERELILEEDASHYQAYDEEEDEEEEDADEYA